MISIEKGVLVVIDIFSVIHINIGFRANIVLYGFKETPYTRPPESPDYSIFKCKTEQTNIYE